MYWRLILAAIALIVLIGTHWQAYRSGQTNIRNHYAVEAAKQEQEYRAKEQTLVLAKQATEIQYASLKQANARAAAGAQSELGRLRVTLTQRQASANSTACAGIDATSTEREVLGTSAEALVAMAAEADRIAVQLTGLQAYVGNVCLSQ